MSEVKAKPVKATITTTTSNFVYKVGSGISALEKLRDEATEYNQQYQVGGRNALYKLLSAVYKQYHDATVGGKVQQLSAEVRSKLDALGLKPSKTAHLSNMLVRYVFKDPDAKQVSIWAKALRVLQDKKPTTAPADFVAAIEKQEGGLGGFTEPRAASATARPKLTPVTALSAISENEPTIATLDEVKWEDDETFKIYVAVRNDDDEAELKVAAISDEQKEAVLLRHMAAKNAKPKAKIDPDVQIKLLSLEAEVLNAKMAKVEAQRALSAAKTAKPKADHKKLEDAVAAAASDLTIAQEELKAAKK